MADLWVLHIDSLRQIFDQSLMKIFPRVQKIWSRQESVTEGQMDGQTDRWTDEGHFYNPPSALQRGIKNYHQVTKHLFCKICSKVSFFFMSAGNDYPES